MTGSVRRLSALVIWLLVAAGCAAPGDVIDKWFGSGPAQKPAELVVFKPTATARILWQGNVGSAEKHTFTPAINEGTVYAAGAAGQPAPFQLDVAEGVEEVRLAKQLGEYAVLLLPPEVKFSIDDRVIVPGGGVGFVMVVYGAVDLRGGHAVE